MPEILLWEENLSSWDTLERTDLVSGKGRDVGCSNLCSAWVKGHQS